MFRLANHGYDNAVTPWLERREPFDGSCCEPRAFKGFNGFEFI